jgi:hypothetical protein
MEGADKLKDIQGNLYHPKEFHFYFKLDINESTVDRLLQIVMTIISESETKLTNFVIEKLVNFDLNSVPTFSTPSPELLNWYFKCQIRRVLSNIYENRLFWEPHDWKQA